MLFHRKKHTTLPAQSVAAVASGQIIPLSEVHDEVFSQKMLGDGVAIVPSDDYIVAPCTGRITMLYPTLHAFGMQTADGLEILVHIGIDTVALNGKGFKAFASVNDNVEVGDKIIRIDSHFITNEGYDLTVMILFPNAEEYQLNILRDGYANRGSTIVMTYARKETAHI